jgi:hypothetical protein
MHLLSIKIIIPTFISWENNTTNRKMDLEETECERDSVDLVYIQMVGFREHSDELLGFIHSTMYRELLNNLTFYQIFKTLYRDVSHFFPSNF